jgi:hypothetical protein
VGGVLFLLAGLGVFTTLSDVRPNWNWVGFFALFAAVQAILVGGAVAMYRALGYAKGDWTLLTRGVVDPLVYFAVMALIISASGPVLYKQRLRHYAGEAAAWLKQLHACATTYAAGHPGQGFPARLDLLGPDATKCLEPLPPTGEKAGYVFTYAPSPPEAGGKIPAYSVTARRVDRVAPRERSFYMDATGVIHATSEDRDATTQDPIVQ